jgi:hypothetical protein
MKRPHRYRLYIAFTAVSFLAAATVLAAAPSADQDESPPDDKDLRIKRVEVAAKDNAFTYLQEAWRLRKWDDNTELGEIADWNQAGIDSFLAANKDSLEQIDKAMACRQLQLPPEQVSWPPPDFFYQWLHLPQLFRIRGWGEFRKGHKKEALADAIKLLRFSELLEESKGDLGYQLLGATIRQESLELIREWMHAPWFASDDLRPFAAEIGKHPMRMQNIADAFRADYAADERLIENWKKGGWEGVPPYLRPSVGSAKPTDFNFALNATKRLFAEVCRFRVAIAAKPWHEAAKQWQDWRDALEKLKPPWAGHFNAALDKPNGLGLFLYYRRCLSEAGFVQLYATTSNEMGMTQLIVALHAYRIDTRKLPEKLDDLVPKYLAALPIDEFDGKPLRYNLEKKLVYSVGKDLKDSGGMTQEEVQAWAETNDPNARVIGNYKPALWSLPDPSYPIDPLPSPPDLAP